MISLSVPAWLVIKGQMPASGYTHFQGTSPVPSGPMVDSIQTVAVFDASEDTVAMLTTVLSERGFRAVSGHADDVKSGALDFIASQAAPAERDYLGHLAPV